MNFFRKVLLEIINFFYHNKIVFYIAKRLALFDAVFVMYPATPLFANHYTFSFRQRRITWSPWITGIIRHPSGKMMLQLAISATEELLVSAGHADEMREMYKKTIDIQKAIGAETNHFAGIIPGCLVQLRVKRNKNELEATAKNVVNAILRVRSELQHDETNVVVILGSKGYVGREVTKNLADCGVAVKGIDIDDTYVKPFNPHIIVNITRPEMINSYITGEFMDEGTTLVNEVYPAPHESVVEEIKALGSRVFHIAGVKAVCLPLFPSKYESAVPCCAALPSEVYSVMVVQL